MLKVQVYSSKGVKGVAVALPKEYDVKPNLNLLAQAIRVYEDRSHFGVARAKTRSEIVRTTKKWYRQKGTGNARHGARSAPIFVGGGKAHGPRPLRRILSLPSQLKKVALYHSIALRAKDGGVVVVDGIAKMSKTGDVAKLLKKITKDFVYKKFSVIVPSELKQGKAFRNLKSVSVVKKSDMNAYGIYFGGGIIFDKDALIGKVVSEAKKKVVTK